MHSQLEGRIFNHDGRIYLVVKDNDWRADTVKVKTVDRHRDLKELPVKTVFQSVAQSLL
jgi:hypothetical protein